MTRDDLLEQHDSDVRHVVEKLTAHFATASPADALAALLRDVRQGVLPREGRLEGVGRYMAHGAGCCFEVRGRPVDLDLDFDHREVVWDAWRVGWYLDAADGGGRRGLDTTALEERLRERVRVGAVREVGRHWFALAPPAGRVEPT